MSRSELAAEIGRALTSRNEGVAVAEGSCGGLLSAELVGVPGASQFFVAGAILYTRTAFREILGDTRYALRGLEGATPDFSRVLAELVAKKFASTWAIAESGASGPEGNRYGHPPGHAALAVYGPICKTRVVETGLTDRRQNMERFTAEALDLLSRAIAEHQG